MESGSTVDIRQVLERLEPELVYMNLIQGQLFSKQFFGVQYITSLYTDSEFRTQTSHSHQLTVRSSPILSLKQWLRSEGSIYPAG